MAIKNNAPTGGAIISVHPSCYYYFLGVAILGLYFLPGTGTELFPFNLI